MSRAQKVIFVITGLIFSVSLTGLVVFGTFRATFGSSQQPKSWLAESGAYDSFVDALLEQAQKSASERQPGELPVTDPAVQIVAKQAFSPALLRAATEIILDSTYSWLNGTVKRPDFEVDFSPAKAEFATGIGQYVKTRLSSLPVCAPGSIPSTLDVFSATCLPPGFSADSESQRVTNEVLGNKDFLGNPVVTADNLKIGGSQKSVFDQAAAAPRWFRLARALPYVFGALALVGAVSIVFLEVDRRAAIRRVAKRLLVSGILLGVSVLTLVLVSRGIDQRISSVSNKSQAMQTVALKVVKAADQTINRTLVIFAVIFVAIGGMLYLSLLIHKRYRGRVPPVT